MQTAIEVAHDEYPGFTYGDEPSQRKVNCVQFVERVIQTLLHRRLTSSERNAIYIRTDFANLDRAIEFGDQRTKGVIYALDKVIRCGYEVLPIDAAPGDFIQYWI